MEQEQNISQFFFISFQESDYSQQAESDKSKSFNLYSSINSDMSTSQSLQIFNFNNQSFDQENEDLSKKGSKKARMFKKIQKKFRTTGSATQEKKQISDEDSLRLFAGLQITKEGVIRSHNNNIQLSFGYLYNSINVKYFKNSQIVEVFQQAIQPNAEIPIEQVLEYLSQTQCLKHEETQDMLKEIYCKKNNLRDQLQTLKISDQLLNLHHQQLNLFLQQSEHFIQEYALKNTGIIFQYFIRKINLITKNEEVVKAGYSKSFLDLIGIDVEYFSQNMLKNNKINLYKDSQEEIKQTHNDVENTQDQSSKKNEVQIKTLDGINLTINYEVEQINLSDELNISQQMPFLQKLSIVKIKVDNKEIQNLILQRQKLLVKKKQILTYEEFMNQEVQILLTNQVYDQQQQKFIERYYEYNAKEIYKQQKKRKKVEDKYVEKQFQIISI